MFLSFRVLSLGKKRHLLRAGSRFDSRVVLTVAFSRMPRTMLVTHVGTNFDHAPLAFRGRFSVIFRVMPLPLLDLRHRKAGFFRLQRFDPGCLGFKVSASASGDVRLRTFVANPPETCGLMKRVRLHEGLQLIRCNLCLRQQQQHDTGRSNSSSNSNGTRGAVFHIVAYTDASIHPCISAYIRAVPHMHTYMHAYVQTCVHARVNYSTLHCIAT